MTCFQPPGIAVLRSSPEYQNDTPALVLHAKMAKIAIKLSFRDQIKITNDLSMLRYSIFDLLCGCINYGHDDFSIGLMSDTTPHVECYDVIME